MTIDMLMFNILCRSIGLLMDVRKIFTDNTIITTKNNNKNDYKS